MLQSRRQSAPRGEIRRNIPVGPLVQRLGGGRAAIAVGVAVCFWLTSWGITVLRDQMVRVRLGQYTAQDVASRVKFVSRDLDRENEIREEARKAAPRVYRRVEGSFALLEGALLTLPLDIDRTSPEQLPKNLRLDGGAITALKMIAKAPREQPGNIKDWEQWVRAYVEQLKAARDKNALVAIPYDDRDREARLGEPRKVKAQFGADPTYSVIDLKRTFAAPRKPGEPLPEVHRGELLSIIGPIASRHFESSLAANIAGFTIDNMQPTHTIEADLTADEQERAARMVSLAPARRNVQENTVLAPKGSIITGSMWKLLSDEQHAYIASLRKHRPTAWLLSHAGMGLLVLLLAAAMSLCVAMYQPRVIQSPWRAVAIAAMLAAMLLLAQLCGVSTFPLLVFGLAPTILAAMILNIAYEPRFASRMAALHGLLTTVALDQGVSFFVIAMLGVMTCCFLLNEVRTRSKLIEVGGATALMMMLATAATGALAGEPPIVVGYNCLYAGAAGLGVGFIALGILPFIEKAFRITTSMTLLELADVSQPLLRRLALEAPGTYNHSLQVATLAEAAAEAIRADSLLCRVGSYYHDIGKMSKADYFCENQFDGPNRHLNLSPSVSMLIIAGHVKDGMELAREYRLPPAITPLIQQHHGTTVVEHFYHQARQKASGSDMPQVSDSDYRYAGPRPRSREAVVVMMADAVESATRSMIEPTASRVESLVHDLIMRRLTDGQFDEADMTFAELTLVEKALVKTLLSIHHARMAYPSTAAYTHPNQRPSAAAKSA